MPRVYIPSSKKAKKKLISKGKLTKAGKAEADKGDAEYEALVNSYQGKAHLSQGRPAKVRAKIALSKKTKPKPKPKKKKKPPPRPRAELEFESESDTSDTQPMEHPPAPAPAPAPAPPPKACITNTAIKRLCKQAGAKRIAKDSYPTIREEFERVLLLLSKRSNAIKQMERKKTLQPKHVRVALKGMGRAVPVASELQNLKFTKAPIVKCIKHALKDTRVGNEAVMILMSATSHIILKWIRSAVGLKAHNGLATLDSRDLKNVQTICDSKTL
jgi:histone H3/H4